MASPLPLSLLDPCLAHCQLFMKEILECSASVRLVNHFSNVHDDYLPPSPVSEQALYL